MTPVGVLRALSGQRARPTSPLLPTVDSASLQASYENAWHDLELLLHKSLKYKGTVPEVIRFSLFFLIYV